MKTVLGLLFWLSASPAWAYLDPGSGSMLLQLLLGGLAGLGVIVRLYWHRVQDFFGVRKKTDDPPDTGSPSP